MSFEKPVITHRTALCLHTHCSYSCLRHLQKLLSNSGLRHTTEADNINKKRHAFPSGRSQVTVTTTWLGMMWVRRDITRWEVRSCCRSTHRLPAADLRSSGAVVLTGLVPQRDSPAPDTPLGTLFSCHSCWQMALHRVIQLPWRVTGGSRAAGRGVGDSSLPGDCWVWGGIWGCNSFCDRELNWFNTGTNPKSSACQSTFSSKKVLSLTLLRKK